MSPPVDLLASYWTLAVGAEPHTDHEYSTVSFRDRVASAARAGFSGLGLWHADLEHTLQTHTLEDMRRILDDHGIRHVELEFLTDWFVDGEAKRRSDERKQLLLRAAEVLRTRSIKVGDFVGQTCPMDKLIERFAGLCREAADHGTRIAFEMMPFCIVNSLELARTLAEGAAQPNGGIFFDLWHIVKLGIAYDAVARFPARYVSGIELNDGYSREHSMPDFVVETTQHRQLCGEGEFDVRGFVAAMRGTGFRGPWGIEVLNKVLRSRPIDEVTQRSFQTTIAQFGA